MSQNQTPDINALFQNAQQDGNLSLQSFQTLQVMDLGDQIQAALGTPADDVTASEVILVTIMPDDSGSIRFSSNAQAVRGGHNSVLDALMDSKQKDSILVHTHYLNGFILYPYRPLSQVIRMDTKNYDPNKGTPLYDQTLVLLGTVLAKAQEFADNGVPVRTVTLIITDGADTHSVRADAKQVSTLVRDLLAAENHIIATMGIDDGYTDFRQVFREMGIRDEWILTPGDSESEIRKAFQMFSQSTVKLSQSSGKLSLGGFGN